MITNEVLGEVRLVVAQGGYCEVLQLVVLQGAALTVRDDEQRTHQ
jgi:hypothetical protein